MNDQERREASVSKTLRGALRTGATSIVITTIGVIVAVLVIAGLLVWAFSGLIRPAHADPTWRGCATNENAPVHTRSGECGDGRTAPQPTVTPPSPPPVDHKPPKDPKPPKDEEDRSHKPGKGKWH